MNLASDSHLAAIDATTLTGPVRKLLQRERAELLDWKHQPLHGGVGDLGTGIVGIYRFAGQVRDGDEVVPWSLVLKATHATLDAANGDYFSREFLAYRSGFLTDLSASVVAPRCLGTSQPRTDLLWLWLEHLVGAEEQPWPLACHAQVAHHFGQWNGGYLMGSPPPNYPWFCQSTTREWTQQAAPDVEFLRTVLDHPWIRLMFPDDQAQIILHLWDERETFFQILEHLPQTLCHNDVFRRNLFMRHTADGRAQTVAIDWANVGWGAIGEEIATMVVGNLVFDEVGWSLAEELTKSVFDAYLAGLQEAGWAGDPRLVRLGFTAAAAMKYSFPYDLRAWFTAENQVWVEQVFNQNWEEVLAGFVKKRPFIFALAAEAQRLMDEVDDILF